MQIRYAFNLWQAGLGGCNFCQKHFQRGVGLGEQSLRGKGCVVSVVCACPRGLALQLAPADSSPGLAQGTSSRQGAPSVLTGAAGEELMPAVGQSPV